MVSANPPLVCHLRNPSGYPVRCSLPLGIRAGLLVARKLGKGLEVRGKWLAFLVAVEQRVAKTDHRSGRGAGMGHSPQRFQRGNRRQHR